MDKKDLLSFFYYIKKKYNDEEEILQLLENYEINKLDISRMYRFIDKFVNYENNTTGNDEIVEEVVE